DAVVHHLHEVARPGGPAVQIAVLRGAAELLTSRGPRGQPHPGSERLEDRVETPHHRLLAADHETEAALETPHPAARPHVDVVQPAVAELGGPTDVVVVVRVAAIDH